MFRLSAAGQLTTLHAFNASELSAVYQWGGLLESRDGLFYGMAYQECDGLVQSCVVQIIYSLTHDGAFNVVDRLVEGQVLSSPLIEREDGTIYGSTLRNVPSCCLVPDQIF